MTKKKKQTRARRLRKGEIRTEFKKQYHVCWFADKKHCRTCGERELDVFLNLFGNGIAEYSHE